MNNGIINKISLLSIIFIISIIFFAMTHQFLMPVFIAALLTAMVMPIHKAISARIGNRTNLSAIITVLGILLIFVIPLSALITVVVSQAISVGQSVTPWIQQFASEPTLATKYLEKLPFYQEVLPYRNIILEKAGALVGSISTLLVNYLSAFTKNTINALFSTVVMLYVTFYFLNVGHTLLGKILYFLPLNDKDEQQLLARFTSVTRATIKGTVIIGLVQGAICGTSFALAGITGPVFWGTVMAVMSVVPVVGTAIVWLPALIIIAVMGNISGAIILVIFCGLIAGNIDNLLRPRLVGKDTEMHDLFVLFGTLGGISMFGMVGLVIGPIITALFITLWDIYGESFSEYLPEVHIFQEEVAEENQDKVKLEKPEEVSIKTTKQD